MKISAKITAISVILVFLLVMTSGSALCEEYPALKGVKSVKAVFGFEMGNPQNALVHLQVIHQTFKDNSVWIGQKKPEIVVVFYGPAVKLASKNRSGFTDSDLRILNEYASTISAMSKDGIKFEICLIAVKLLGVEPSSILPEIRQVGNGWISVIGYEARGYSFVPVGG